MLLLDPKDTSAPPVMIVARPTHYRIEKPINKKMKENAHLDPVELRERALEQHANMVAIMRKVGVLVLELEGDPRHPDACFIRDFCITLRHEEKSFMVIGDFASDTRQGEHEALLPFLDPAHIIYCHDLKHACGKRMVMEGGDFRQTPFFTQTEKKRIIIAGHGPRTQQHTIDALNEDTRLKPYFNFVKVKLSSKHFEDDPSNLVDAESIHTDTVCDVLPRGEVVIFNDGFARGADGSHSEANKIIQMAHRHGKSILFLTDHEAYHLATNKNALTHEQLLTPILHRSHEDFLCRHGYVPNPCDLSAFEAAGGAANCLTQEVTFDMLNSRGLQLLAYQNPHARDIILGEIRNPDQFAITSSRTANVLRLGMQ